MPEMTEITYSEKILPNDDENSSEMLTRKHKRYISEELNYTVEYSKNISTDVEMTTLPSFDSLNESSLNMNESTIFSREYFNEIDTANSTENSTLFYMNGTDVSPTLEVSLACVEFRLRYVDIVMQHELHFRLVICMAMSYQSFFEFGVRRQFEWVEDKFERKIEYYFFEFFVQGSAYLLTLKMSKKNYDADKKNQLVASTLTIVRYNDSSQVL